MSPKKSSPIATKMASIRVKVEDQSLNVPVSNIEDLTVGWLAKEAARRYYKFTSRSEDGAIFENDDPISVTFGEMISSSVLDWKLPPISKRYLEVCQQLKTGRQNVMRQAKETFNFQSKNLLQNHFQSTLELIQATQELKIHDQSLDKLASEPIFKSLQHHTNLESIDLANNFLEDEILKLFVTILPTLPRLKYLNLSGNHITRDGITNLASVPANQFLDLESLDLSYNPLTNHSIPSLNVLLAKAKNLKKLSLCATDITDIPYPPNDTFKYSQITDIDFSLNRIELSNLNRLLKKLSSCQIVSLNLSFSCTDRGVMESIVAILNAGTCERLRDLNLSGLDLEDGDIWTLLQALERTKNLNRLRLLENRRLTSTTLKLLLERLSAKQLELNGCWKLYAKIGDNVYVSGQCTIPIVRMTCDPVTRTNDLEWINEIWRRMFGDRANVRVRHNCVTLTVDER